MNRGTLAVALILPLAACGGDDAAPAGPNLAIKDLVVGTGAVAAIGDSVTVHYVGTLTNGQTFDSSNRRGQPLTFRIGSRQVIAGLEQGISGMRLEAMGGVVMATPLKGIPGMRVGGKRRVTIPPSLAYGNRAFGPIPANSTLIFEVDLIAITGR